LLLFIAVVNRYSLLCKDTSVVKLFDLA